MSLRASDVVPISEARARLTELADDVVGRGTEKLLTKNGASYVALVDARKLDYYHALEAEHAGLVLVQGELKGLEGLAAGRVLDEGRLDRALSAACEVSEKGLNRRVPAGQWAHPGGAIFRPRRAVRSRVPPPTGQRQHRGATWCAARSVEGGPHPSALEPCSGRSARFLQAHSARGAPWQPTRWPLPLHTLRQSSLAKHGAATCAGSAQLLQSGQQAGVAERAARHRLLQHLR
jgi:hypothetical protein